MKTKVVITIDTEPDNLWDLNLRKNPQFKNISELPKLQKLFDKFHAKATYLVTFSVVKSDAIAVLKDIAKFENCEIGTHLHALETPPFKPQINGDGSYLHQYSFDVQSQKMANLDGLITETFGCKPLSYRGGRWSFDKNTISILAKYGYLVDTSVTPGISWENDGGQNFKKSHRKDYFLQTENNVDILEVPVSIEIKTRIPRLSKFIYLNTPNWTHVEGILRRLAGFNIILLDPSFNRYEEMKWACDLLLEKGVRHLNIMTHSSVIIPGGSPYTMSEESTNKFFERLERLLDYLLKVRKLEPLTLKEFYNYRKNNLSKEIS